VSLLGAGRSSLLLNGQEFSQGFLRSGLYDLLLRADVLGPGSAELVWRRDEGQTEPIPASNVLRKGLPPWGVVERYTSTGEGPVVPRWLPGIWLDAPGQRLSGPPPSGIEFVTRVWAPEPGVYKLFYLSAQPKPSIRADGDVLPPAANPTEWAVRLSTGWHDFRAAVEAPQAEDFRLYWIGPGDDREIVGGVRTLRPR
jgi:hypothetical protein